MRKLTTLVLAMLALASGADAQSTPPPLAAYVDVPSTVNKAASVVVWQPVYQNGVWTVQPFSSSGGSGTASSVSQNGTWQVNLGYNGALVGPANPLGVSDLALDALISGGKLSVAASGSVSVANFPGTQAVSLATLGDWGPIAPAAATATHSAVIGCQYNSSATAVSNGQQTAVACDGFARLQVNVESMAPLVAGSASIGTVVTTPKTGTFSAPGCTVGTSAANCLAAGVATNHVTLENNSGNVIACSFTTTATLNSGTSFQLSPGQATAYGSGTSGVPSGALSCIASAASSALYVEYN